MELKNNLMAYLTAILCVFFIAAGQILFKLSADLIAKSGTYFSEKIIIIFGSAIFIYGATTLIWVWLLQRTELGKIYPIMALGFALVPLGSYFIFGEKFSNQYYIGIVFIVLGVVLTTKA